MKKLVSIIILCLGCIGILGAQNNIWKPINGTGILGVGPDGSIFAYGEYGSLSRSQGGLSVYKNYHIGLDEPEESVFAVYPNPTHGVLTIHHSTFIIPHSSFRITNLMGQTLMTGTISEETQQIDVTNLPQGMYFISIGDTTCKFVVR